MAVKSKDELLSTIKTIIGDAPSDEAISLLEDLSDTLDNSTGESTENDKKKIEELEKQVKDMDEMWRKRYTERFFNPSDKTSDEIETEQEQTKVEEEDNTPKTFGDLFGEQEK